MRRVLIGMALLALLSACSSPRTSSPSVTEDPAPSSSNQTCVSAGLSGSHTIDVGGQQREYLVAVPDSWDGVTPLPVVYTMHGTTGTADFQLEYSRLAEYGNRDSFISVSLQGLGDPSTWDVHTPASTANSDMAFVLDLTSAMDSTGCIQADRQYLTGYSAGSGFAFAAACSGDFPFAAYGGVSGALYADGCDEAPPASIIYFHGDSDQVVPITGGDVGEFVAPPVDVTMADWAAHDGCDPTEQRTDVAVDVQEYAWANCKDSALVAYIIDGGGHTWPGATIKINEGKTADSINATELMLQFFELAPQT